MITRDDVAYGMKLAGFTLMFLATLAACVVLLFKAADKIGEKYGWPRSDDE